LCQKYDDRFQVRQNQTTHHRVKAVSQNLFILDAQYQHADAAFQQADICEEKNLRHPRQKIDVFVVCLRKVPPMAPISVLDRIDLNGCSNHSKKTAY